MSRFTLLLAFLAGCAQDGDAPNSAQPLHDIPLPPTDPGPNPRPRPQPDPADETDDPPPVTPAIALEVDGGPAATGKGGRGGALTILLGNSGSGVLSAATASPTLDAIAEPESPAPDLGPFPLLTSGALTVRYLSFDSFGTVTAGQPYVFAGKLRQRHATATKPSDAVNPTYSGIEIPAGSTLTLPLASVFLSHDVVVAGKMVVGPERQSALFLEHANFFGQPGGVIELVKADLALIRANQLAFNHATLRALDATGRSNLVIESQLGTVNHGEIVLVPSPLNSLQKPSQAELRALNGSVHNHGRLVGEGGNGFHGGRILLNAKHAVLNDGEVQIGGGSGSAGSNGGTVELQADVVRNAGPIVGVGGEGSATCGGHGGSLQLRGRDIDQRGPVDLRGGAGQAPCANGLTGGHGGGVYLEGHTLTGQSNRAVVSGYSALHARGGAGPIGGDGGRVLFQRSYVAQSPVDAIAPIVNRLPLDVSGAPGGAAGSVSMRAVGDTSFLHGLVVVVNHAPITADGTKVHPIAIDLFANDAVENHGPLRASGNDVRLHAELGAVYNEAAIDTSAPVGGWICLEGSRALNHAPITTSGSAGAGGTLTLRSFLTASEQTSTLALGGTPPGQLRVDDGLTCKEGVR